MTETFYDVLGVPEAADQDEITAAYREKVKKYHPDVSDRDDAAERFKTVTRAEEVLGDEAERARYDRLGHDAYVRHLDGANAAGSERSPWTSSGDDRSRGGNDATDSSGARSTRERARAAAGADDDGGASQHRKQRRRRRARERRADPTWTPGDADAASAGAGSGGPSASGSGGSGNDSGAGSGESSGGTASSYTVHDWEPADRSFIGGRPSMTRNAIVQAAILALLYPALLYSSVAPAFSPVVNVVVAALTLLLIGYLLTLPLVGGAVFGLWSVLAPLAVSSLGYDPISVPMLVAVLGCWIPLGYSITVALVLRW